MLPCFSTKLQLVKGSITKWSCSIFGKIDHNITLMEYIINYLDLISNEKALEDSELNEIKENHPYNHCENVWKEERVIGPKTLELDGWGKEIKTQNSFIPLPPWGRQNTITSLFINETNIVDPAGIKEKAKQSSISGIFLMKISL